MKTALVIVDVQNDFVEGGALGCESGNLVARRIAEHLKTTTYDAIITTQDWHIKPGSHFVLWPVHCVAETTGAELHDDISDALAQLPSDASYHRVVKGMYSDGYSGFDGYLYDPKKNDSLSLDQVLTRDSIDRIVVVGIATDYCVKKTALSGVDHGYQVTVLTDLITGVAPESSHEALEIMAAAGVTLVKNNREEAKK